MLEFVLPQLPRNCSRAALTSPAVLHLPAAGGVGLSHMGRLLLLLFKSFPEARELAQVHLHFSLSSHCPGECLKYSRVCLYFLRVTDTRFDQNLTLVLLQDLNTLSRLWDTLLFGFP